MKRLSLFVLSLWTAELFAASPAIQNNVGSIEGMVIDRNTHQLLPGASVIIVGSTMGAATRPSGRFFITNVPFGTYQVKATLIGYKPEVKTESVIFAKRVATLDFELSQTAVELEEAVEVTVEHFEKDAEKPTSAKTLALQEIRFSPGAAEDVFRIMECMPGVSPVGSKDSKLIVRGGAPDENRTLLENIEIYNPLHFSRPGASLGAISIVNPSLLERIDFLSGGFPAKYGDKMSSVFEMQLKEGDRINSNTDLNLNLAGFGVVLDGPIHSNGTMLFSVRRGVFDLLTSMLNVPVSPAYWDVVGKVTYNLGGSHRLSLLGFCYLDDFEEPRDSTECNKLLRTYDYKRDDYGVAVGLNWRYLPTKRAYMLTTAALVSNGWKTSFGTENDPELLGDEIKEGEVHLKSELTYILSDAAQITGGIFGKTINSDHHIWAIADTTLTGVIIPAYDLSYNPPLTFKAGSFLQTTLRPFGEFSLSAGLRYDYFELTREAKTSPRLGLSYYLTHKTTLNAAFGHYYQTPSAHQVALDPANLVLRSSRAIHYIAGVEHLLRHDTKISLEAYHKDLDNLLGTNAGSGYAQGVEFYVQKKMSNNLAGSFAYSYSVSKRQDQDFLPEYYSEFDRPHNLTLVASYKLSDRWQIGMKFQYASGNPYTPVVSAVEKDGRWDILYGAKNSARYPDYHNLDIRIDRSFHFRNWTLLAHVDLWNVYNRENILFYYYDVDDNGVIRKEALNGFPMFPVLGVSAQF